ncbi:MAG: MipA/OmpV family protein [Rhizobiaceae bacterium]|nr:MipA/OmpV family protein [Rhizobiaceae bacterium]
MFSTPQRAAIAAFATAFLAISACWSIPVEAADLTDDSAAAPEAPAADSSFDQVRFGGVEKTLSDWHFVVGAGAMYGPTYEGSKEMKVTPVPFISATPLDRVHVDPSGITLDAFTMNGFTLGLKGGYDLGRKQSDGDRLHGLGDIDAAGVVGARASYQFGSARIYADIDRMIGGSDGLQGKIGADLTEQYDKFLFSAGASATLADDKYMQSYFGVTEAQSERSSLAAYDAKGGLKRFDVDTSVTYMATKNWLIRGQAGVGFLAGDAKDSPIVERYVQPSAMLVVGYKF